jgi:hypothetical protein
VEWIDGVIPLPIPRGVTTLSFEVSDELRTKTIDGAREATRSSLLRMAKPT